MEFPNTWATHMTERIMRLFSRHDPENAVLPLDTPDYNAVFSRIHTILTVEEECQKNLKAAEKRGFDTVF